MVALKFNFKANIKGIGVMISGLIQNIIKSMKNFSVTRSTLPKCEDVNGQFY